MELVTWVMFESLLALVATLFTVNFVLLVYWRRSGRARPLLVGLASAVVLIVLQALVVTRREHAARILDTIERDVVAARTDALAEALAPNFRAHGQNRDEFLTWVARQYERFHVRSVQRTRLRMLRSEPEQFVVSAAYQVDLADSEYGGAFPTAWEITFVRTDAGWQISEVRPTYLAGFHDPGWNKIDLP